MMTIRSRGTPSFAIVAQSSGFCTSTVELDRRNSQPSMTFASARSARAFAVVDANVKPSPANALSFCIGSASAANEPMTVDTTAT